MEKRCGIQHQVSLRDRSSLKALDSGGRCFLVFIACSIAPSRDSVGFLSCSTKLSFSSLVICLTTFFHDVGTSMKLINTSGNQKGPQNYDLGRGCIR